MGNGFGTSFQVGKKFLQERSQEKTVAAELGKLHNLASIKQIDVADKKLAEALKPTMDEKMQVINTLRKFEDWQNSPEAMDIIRYAALVLTEQEIASAFEGEVDKELLKKLTSHR